MKNEKTQSELLIRKGALCPFCTKDGNFWITITEDGHHQTFPLTNSRQVVIALKSIYKRLTGERITLKICEDAIEELEEYAYEHRISSNLEHRFAYKNGEIFYDLDGYDGVAVKISAEGYDDEMVTPPQTFIQNSTYAPQVRPDEEAEEEELPGLLEKHFNLKDEAEVKLFAIYLVSTFLSPIINVPILILNGEKGSSKSTALRRLEQIIDPKTIDLTGAPKSDADLEVRLHNNCFITLDNLSFLSKKTSDLLARSVTGGSASRRQLYTDANEISLNLKCMVALNGIGMIAREADLLDRALLFTFTRIDEKQIKTERELQESFAEDLPKILGAIFLCVSAVLGDEDEVVVERKTRMADFFETAIKIGRVFSMADEETAELLWKNHKFVNRQTLCENIVAQCLEEFMMKRKEYKGSVTELLGKLYEVAENNNIKLSSLPGQPNVLSRRLNEIKSNLEMTGIFFEVKNKGSFREIHIWKK